MCWPALNETLNMTSMTYDLLGYLFGDLCVVICKWCLFNYHLIQFSSSKIFCIFIINWGIVFVHNPECLKISWPKFLDLQPLFVMIDLWPNNCNLNLFLFVSLLLFQPKDRAKLKQEASPNFERQNSVTSDASIEVKKIIPLLLVSEKSEALHPWDFFGFMFQLRRNFVLKV